MIRKILGTFKTTPVQWMEIESHVLPVKLRLLKIAENNPICQRIPNTYSIKYENIGFDTSLWNNKYAEWNEDEKQTNKRHPSQLICVLHSVSDIVYKTDEFEPLNHFIKPWKSSCKIEFQIENTKESVKSSYYSHCRLIEGRYELLRQLGTHDYRTITRSSKLLKKLTAWIIKANLLTQFSLASQMLYEI